jgi:hypothetical protein
MLGSTTACLAHVHAFKHSTFHGCEQHMFTSHLTAVFEEHAHATLLLQQRAKQHVRLQRTPSSDDPTSGRGASVPSHRCVAGRRLHCIRTSRQVHEKRIGNQEDCPPRCMRVHMAFHKLAQQEPRKGPLGQHRRRRRKPRPMLQHPGRPKHLRGSHDRNQRALRQTMLPRKTMQLALLI